MNSEEIQVRIDRIYAFDLLELITKNFKDQSRTLNYVSLSRLGHTPRFSSPMIRAQFGNHTVINNIDKDIEYIFLYIEKAVGLPNLSYVQYSLTDKSYLYVFEDEIITITPTCNTLLYSISLDKEKVISNTPIKSSLGLLKSLFDPSVERYHSLVLQHFMDNGYIPPVR